MSNSIADKLQQAFGRFNARDLAGTERLCGEILGAVPGHPDALHLLGVLRMVSGKPREAVSLIGRALEVTPRDAAMQENLGMARVALGDYRAAEAAFRQALALGASHALLYMRLGLALGAQGKLADAVSALRIAAGLSPGDADVHLNLGNALAESGQREESLGCYQKVLALQPNHATARFNLGNLFRTMGRLEEAEASFRQALVAAPDDPDVHNNLGIIYQEQQRLDDAAASYRRALALNPGHVSAHNNLGNVLRAQKRVEEAVNHYQAAMTLDPAHPDAYVNLGNLRAEQGACDEARTLYEKALQQHPQSFEAHCNLGRLHADQGDVKRAAQDYQRALAVNDRLAFVHGDLASVYRMAGELDAAVACHQTAIVIEPRNADAHFSFAETRKLQGRYDEAIVLYRKALELNPDHLLALNGLVHLRQHVCSWEGIEESWARLQRGMSAVPAAGASPFTALSQPTSAAEQLACARAWAQRELAPFVAARSGLAFSFPAPRTRERLRIGYLSWGFHRHATAYLTPELFELHDRARFEVFAYAYGPDDGSAIRTRIRSACEHFTDVSGEATFATAQRIYDDGVDVLVDLTGYTLGARTPILALRPAPVQVNWLGYPGTMGTDCVDTLVADPFIIPPGQEGGYAEKVVRLPDCYQINDRRREIGERVPTREECGLPAAGIVFCCFNQAYKILPETFALWMRVVQAVPGSVLWLAEANPWMAANLRRVAAAAGVAAERLVFTPRKSLPEYLVQYRLADLALDTFPYTSHTTASDALWMGCPLVTRVGETFASRVAGSILNSAGLPELVTDSLAQYESLAIDLASSPEMLRGVRRKLHENRASCALFDTPRFVGNLERAYEAMYSAFVNGAGE